MLQKIYTELESERNKFIAEAQQVEQAYSRLQTELDKLAIRKTVLTAQANANWHVMEKLRPLLTVFIPEGISISGGNGECSGGLPVLREIFTDDSVL